MASRNIDRIAVYLVLIIMAITIASQGRYTIQAIGQGEERQQQLFLARLSGQEEVPPTNSQATGAAEFELIGEDSMGYSLDATNIEAATAAHIHSGFLGENGPIVVTLFRSDSPTNEVSQTGSITADKLEGPMAGNQLSDLIAAMRNGETYVNIHTEENPDGEIRGQITAAGREEQQQQSMLDSAPELTCIYQGREYSTMTPFNVRDGQGAVQSGFPKLPDNIEPEMIVQDGRTITMEFEKNPTRVEAFLADYDADVAVRYPLEDVSENTFILTPEGTKTLEVRATFPDNLQVMYSTLVDVKSMQ
jgi:hypothetical protein